MCEISPRVEESSDSPKEGISEERVGYACSHGQPWRHERHLRSTFRQKDATRVSLSVSLERKQDDFPRPFHPSPLLMMFSVPTTPSALIAVAVCTVCPLPLHSSRKNEAENSPVGLAQTLAWMMRHVVYNLYFHPLANFPGPCWARASLVSFAQGPHWLSIEFFFLI